MAELKTIKELAQELDCSYEAVRQHVKRYQRQLSDHISYIGKSQYLDEWACDFIKSKRVESPITVRTVERNERITELENENKLLLQQLAVVQNEMLKLKDEKHALELENARIALLEADNEAKDKKVEEAVKTAEDANLRLTEAHESFEAELKKRDEQIQELKNRKWYQLLFKKNKE